MRRLLLVLATAALSVVAEGHAGAADLRNVLTDHSLTSWGPANGLPSSAIYAIVQDRAGYLWLGTDAGLVRFDGVMFLRWEAVGPTSVPRAPVRALLVSRDGSIWIGLGGDGGVSRIRDGRVENYGVPHGLGAGAITTLVEDRDGIVWAGNRTGLHTFTTDHWTQVSGEDLPHGPVHSAFVDVRGRLLVGTAAGVFERPAGDHSFRAVDMPGVADMRAQRSIGTSGDAIRAISVDANGGLWLSDPAVGVRGLVGRRVLLPAAEKGRGVRLLHDASGDLWVGLAGQGIWRVRHDAGTGRLAIDQATALTGLLGNGVNSLMQDREGNIWAGTLDGLNRLTPHKATPVMNLGLVGGVEVSRDGVWVATNDGLLQFDGVGDRSTTPRRSLPLPITAMHADERGSLWLATADAILKMDANRMTTVCRLDGGLIGRVSLLTSDRAGGVWGQTLRSGLVRWRGGHLEPRPLPQDLQEQRVLWMQAQRNGELWLAFADGGVVRLREDGQVERFDSPDAQDVFHAVYEDRGGVIWLGGLRGLTRFADGSFTTLRQANGHRLESLTGIVEDQLGHLWLGTRDGVVRLHPDEFDRAVQSPSHRVRYKLYSKSDGLAGNPRWYGNRGLARAADGRLWFVTSRGVTLLDPRVVLDPEQPAPVRIESIVADRQRLEPQAQASLPPRTKTVEIVYGALALTSSQATQFRYRLAGFESEWTEAGTRRQASYTNLPPGRYEFEVEAGSQEGTWTSPTATWAFAIVPAFYETTWFFGLCAAGVVMMVGAAWRLHVRQVRTHFSMLLGERARLSREIHDTLLQGLFGVALRCEVIAGDLDAVPVSAAKLSLISLRKEVEGYIREARQLISNLRSPRLAQSGLAAALRDAGAHATSAARLGFTFRVTGDARTCAPQVEEHLLRVGQEAVTNAIRHARAQLVHVGLDYGKSDVVLRVVDDGCGFDPACAAAADDHYGLKSMRERVDALRGSLLIGSVPGGGTEIVASVPYAD